MKCLIAACVCLLALASSLQEAGGDVAKPTRLLRAEDVGRDQKFPALAPLHEGALEPAAIHRSGAPHAEYQSMIIDRLGHGATRSREESGPKQPSAVAATAAEPDADVTGDASTPIAESRGGVNFEAASQPTLTANATNLAATNASANTTAAATPAASNTIAATPAAATPAAATPAAATPAAATPAAASPAAVTANTAAVTANTAAVTANTAGAPPAAATPAAVTTAAANTAAANANTAAVTANTAASGAATPLPPPATDSITYAAAAANTAAAAANTAAANANIASSAAATHAANAAEATKNATAATAVAANATAAANIAAAAKAARAANATGIEPIKQTIFVNVTTNSSGNMTPSPPPPCVNQTETMHTSSHTTVTKHNIVDTVITTVTNNLTNTTHTLDVNGNPYAYPWVGGTLDGSAIHEPLNASAGVNTTDLTKVNTTGAVNGTANGSANGTVNASSNTTATAAFCANGTVNGIANGTACSAVNGTANATATAAFCANGTINGTVNGTACANEAIATCDNVAVTVCTGATPVHKGATATCPGGVATCSNATCCEVEKVTVAYRFANVNFDKVQSNTNLSAAIMAAVKEGVQTGLPPMCAVEVLLTRGSEIGTVATVKVTPPSGITIVQLSFGINTPAKQTSMQSAVQTRFMAVADLASTLDDGKTLQDIQVTANPSDIPRGGL